MIRRFLFLVLLTIIGCNSEAEKNLFTEVSSGDSNIEFINKLENTKELNALDYMYFYDGGGVSVGDINNDGLPDIYFTANMGSNKLYLNKGDFKFEDITEKAGVAGESDWNTGTVMVDINGDGLLDIYVCAVVGILGFEGHNELFINNGDLTFSEQGATYNLNIKSHANNAAFFDYDKDGDLDMYLLNEGKHSAESFGPASNRLGVSESNGGRLLRNEDGKFINVSQKAGIYSGPNGYGLGVAVADFNNDGWDDFYVSNDFHEDDYYYINNQDGTFTDQLKMHFGKVSRYSMGNDVADVNHDGYPDIITLDMLPEEEKHLKSTLNDNQIKYHKIRENLGYFPQFARNMLQINQKGTYFIDIALYSGVEATDWSWAPLLADYNQDGELDLFVTNGIYGRFNDLDYARTFTDEAISKKVNTSKLFDQKALDLMAKGAVHNYFYKGNSNLKFEDKSGIWSKKTPTESSGAAYADLDNDGDLDLIVNNYNAKPTLLKNNSKNNTYLKLSFKTDTKNTFGLGTKVFAYHKSKFQFRQLYTTRGFQSSVEPIIHFGFSNITAIDSLLIIWPDNTSQTIKNVKTNQTLVLKPEMNRQNIDYGELFKSNKPWFKKVIDSNFLAISHIENNFSEFDIRPLTPYKVSTQGPAFAMADINNDGKMDLFMGGSTRINAQLFTQNDTNILLKQPSYFEIDAISEDVDATFFDADNDGDQDLIVVSGGGEFNNKSLPLKDRLYINNGKGAFSKAVNALPEYFENGSFVRTNDFDNDGDIDLFIGGRSSASGFGKIPSSYLLKNNGKGKFSLVKSELSASLGMLTDAIFTDFDKDGIDDLIVVGEWMSPQFFKNENGIFKNVTDLLAQNNNTGLWQSIAPFDIDGDGDLDYLVGNWGLNTKFKASKQYPLKMFVGDFSKNGKVETLVTFAKNKVYYSINDKDDLDAVFGEPFQSKFKTYKEFAGNSFDQVFDKAFIKDSELRTATNLSSGYLENDKGKFIFKSFINMLQWAPITSFLKQDFDKNGKEEMLIAGNFFGAPPYNAKFDGNIGYMMLSGGAVLNGIDLGINFGNKEIKHLNSIKVKNKNYIIATVNNGKMMVYEVLAN
ncbi:VCBS repeat-containing protein [Lutibacter sp.]|uniref:VCBS repeat-containing protein n=1 Tax=Lutibacter sp. TaxID=1925666 RepID=UPI00273555BB|nr:VCBS repeat-containing protein [Lutibacter sp.]MDP3313710.1 VCBS repeat-containing protein [Lutibacter sp.]